jgi:SAM-dependent methyltransferase/uncharacterized protein YbaR (Trm112 family)
VGRRRLAGRERDSRRLVRRAQGEGRRGLTEVSRFERLRCPRCGRVLLERGRALECRPCAASFPILGGVPCLLDDPASAIGAWRADLARLGALVRDGRDRLLAEAATAALPSTRRRLEQLREGQAEQLRQVEGLFAEVGLEPRPSATAPVGDGVLAYFHQIHRDWGWPPRELEAAFAAVAAVVRAPLRATLVLGAGAARLTRELGVRLGAAPIVALDVNPLPFLVARKILDGATVELTELPSSPRTPDDAAVLRRLGEGLSPGVDVELVLADALAPPVARGVFDTVVTPWFLDQIPPDLPRLASLIHELLGPGGRWLSHGPFVYPRERPMSARYTEPELLELVKCAGFELEATDARRLAFMESPACNQGRSEQVLTFVARRIESARIAEPPEPPWLADTSRPVPVEALARRGVDHPFFTAVTALVDGARSIDDITAVIAATQAIPAEALRVAVRACLADLARPAG